MYKFVLIISYCCFMLVLSFISEGKYVAAIEEQSKQENTSKVYLKNSESCTERCHVNYMAYENKFEVSHVTEIFKHKTHSYEQDMKCISCHDNSEVNTEGHGKLITNDGSFGAHNIKYIKGLINYSMQQLQFVPKLKLGNEQ